MAPEPALTALDDERVFGRMMQETGLIFIERGLFFVHKDSPAQAFCTFAFVRGVTAKVPVPQAPDVPTSTRERDRGCSTLASTAMPADCGSFSHQPEMPSPTEFAEPAR